MDHMNIIDVNFYPTNVLQIPPKFKKENTTERNNSTLDNTYLVSNVIEFTSSVWKWRLKVVNALQHVKIIVLTWRAGALNLKLSYICKWILTIHIMMLLATLVALHFTPVSNYVFKPFRNL